MQQPERVNGIVAAQLRAAKPAASPELRERVLAVASRVPPLPEPGRLDGWLRRALLVLAPAVVVAGVVGIAALSRSGGAGDDTQAAGGAATTPAIEYAAEPRRARAAAAPRAADKAGAPVWDSATPAYESAQREALPRSAGAGASAEESARTLPPSGRRLQEYRATLSVQVASLDALSTATSQAMRITRRLGGYVVRAGMTSPGDGDGDSSLVVRVPVGKVNEAVLLFASLGSVVAQDVSIQDLQVGVNRQNDQIEALRRTIATLRRELQTPGLSDEQRDRLRTRLVNAEVTLSRQLRGREATLRRGRLAVVSLTLTTREQSEIQPPAPPGRFEQTLRDALHVLATAATWILAALIVLGPFLVLAALAVYLDRRRRRRADDRLLDRTAEA